MTDKGTGLGIEQTEGQIGGMGTKMGQDHGGLGREINLVTGLELKGLDTAEHEQERRLHILVLNGQFGNITLDTGIRNTDCDTTLDLDRRRRHPTRVEGELLLLTSLGYRELNLDLASLTGLDLDLVDRELDRGMIVLNDGEREGEGVATTVMNRRLGKLVAQTVLERLLAHVLDLDLNRLAREMNRIQEINLVGREDTAGLDGGTDFTDNINSLPSPLSVVFTL